MVFVALVASAGAAQPPFRSAIELVRLTVTVTLPGGGHLANLTAADFVVEEDGRKQAVTVFSADRQPFSVAFLVDVSASMRGNAFRDARSAVEVFIRQHFGVADEALVCVFSTAVTCADRWSRDAGLLAAALAPVEPRGATRLLDAIPPVLQLFSGARHRKQVLVVLSDGQDVSSTQSAQQVSALLRERQVLLYAVAFPSGEAPLAPPRWGRWRAEPVNLTLLRGLTTPTGGMTFYAESSAQIEEAVRKMALELQHQYLLGYPVPAGPVGIREVSVRLKDKSKASVRARGAYVVASRED